ncbi:MAG: prepilin-type N-terminal cleavage/methylation domain-containing protein [Phycisphaerae bacterium]|nr:prepilin-type N-terminal cleavage/methylation domain-containing protein [Phycisphaerae bacterium]
MTQLRTIRTRLRARRGFNLVELLMALAISAALLSATMVALNACFISYQATTEEASTHTVARLVMHRVLTLVRTGTSFGPLPEDALDNLTSGDEIQFTNTQQQAVVISFDSTQGAILMSVDGAAARIILRGVQRTLAPDGAEVSAFTMEWDQGTRLYRVTLDVTVVGDDSLTTKLDEGLVKPIRLVASAMPRSETW